MSMWPINYFYRGGYKSSKIFWLFFRYRRISFRAWTCRQLWMCRILRDRQKSRSSLPSHVQYGQGGIFQWRSKTQHRWTAWLRPVCRRFSLSAIQCGRKTAWIKNRRFFGYKEELCSITLPRSSKPNDLQLFSLKTYPVYYRMVRGKLTKQFLKRFQNWGIVLIW